LGNLQGKTLSLGRFVRVIATIVLALLMCAWSVGTIFIESFVRPYRTVAERLETGTQRDLEFFSKLEEALKAPDEVLSTCSRELVRSLVTIKLAAVDAAYRSGDQTVVANALTAANSALTEGLRCFPQDGNLWLRLAMVESAQGGPSPRVEHMLKMSAAKAPAEAWIVASRIAFASRMLDGGSPGVREVLRTDMQRYVRYGRPSDVVDLYSKLDERTRALFLEEMDGLDPERRSEIERLIESIDATTSLEK
jgi:hypothetical protein